jgi:hypothetical protein
MIAQQPTLSTHTRWFFWKRVLAMGAMDPQS